MTKKEKKQFLAEVDPVLCKACGYCAEVCTTDVFEQAEAFNVHGYQPMRAAHTDQCIGCLNCFVVCPDFAITITQVQNA